MKIGLFIGRFQPFHLGHLSAIKQALGQVDFLIIGIGSAQDHHTAENPFSADERGGMIEGSLRDEGMQESSYRIVEIPDIHNDAAWPAHVRSITGHFDVLFTGSKNTQFLFKKYDKTTIKPLQFEIKISATEIRELIRCKKSQWQNLVPKAVIKIIKTIE